ncbi:response regulator transcription factor [Candidatus Competibacter phosphatis]|uniref:Response regulator transcription factor n=1 Tax=Candidatus Competibacter phosphatis TaxID=221280 RepID=A0ABX1TFE9_9GAMM|nr:response regulator transcription factor [Candidatus Competibacter phosphatis]NMQ18082.1 response regulator transcription factor [Candidatus Competibacter phosphatis]
MSDEPVVYLLDDEPEMRKALTRLLRAQGLAVQSFASARELLAQAPPKGPACLVLDVAMPEMDGLQVQERLRERGVDLPIVFLSGRGDIPMSVRALKAGAEDFLTKPVDGADLLRAIRAALQRGADRRAKSDDLADLRKRLALLTPREREVLGHVIAGKLNKQIAAALGTGEQNVKVHRGRLMRKLGLKSVADLVRAAERLGLPPEG